MMRALRVLVALTSLIAIGTAPASPRGERWSDLARRIAAANPAAPFTVTLGAEPPRFAFPLPVRPALPVLGSASFGIKPNTPPDITRVYYAPAADTGTAVAALSAALTAAGYVRAKRDDPYPYARAGDYGPAQHFCPADSRRPAVDIDVETVDALPALDLTIVANAATAACGDGVEGGPVRNTRGVELTTIPGLTMHSRTVLTPGYRGAFEATATVETTLPAAEAVAKIAERFIAKGWSARPPVVTAQTITQRFTRVEAAYRFEVLLVFDHRRDGVYDLLIEFPDPVVNPAGS